jgi:hypothetical protein
VEELTKMVLESGLLEEREDGYALTGPLPPLAIPATLHDSLLARLDRLGARNSGRHWGASFPMPCSRRSRRGTRAPYTGACTS